MGVEDGHKSSGGIGRRTDKRLVKQVLLPNHVPSNWVPMDMHQAEVKLMEVRKYSAEYHDMDTKFRRPNFELINAFAIQNPFLFGCYTLRKEHMKMQIEPNVKVKEKTFYFPTSFEKLEDIIRYGLNVGAGEDGIKLFASSTDANDQIEGSTNPRVLIVSRALLGICQLIPEDHVGGAISRQPMEAFNKNRLDNVYTPDKNFRRKVDSFTTEDKSFFLKMNGNEIYPETVLIYRDKSGPSDKRTSRITELSKRGIVLSYRSGTRFNPEEESFENVQNESLELKPVKDNANREKRKDAKSKTGTKKGKKPKENMDPKDNSQAGKINEISKSDVEMALEEKKPEDKSVLKSEIRLISETDGAAMADKNININVDEYVDTGAIPKRSNQ